MDLRLPVNRNVDEVSTKCYQGVDRVLIECQLRVDQGLIEGFDRGMDQQLTMDASQVHMI